MTVTPPRDPRLTPTVTYLSFASALVLAGLFVRLTFGMAEPAKAPPKPKTPVTTPHHPRTPTEPRRVTPVLPFHSGPAAVPSPSSPGVPSTGAESPSPVIPAGPGGTSVPTRPGDRLG
jgi:hypothetical protein